MSMAMPLIRILILVDLVEVEVAVADRSEARAFPPKAAVAGVAEGVAALGLVPARRRK